MSRDGAKRALSERPSVGVPSATTGRWRQPMEATRLAAAIGVGVGVVGIGTRNPPCFCLTPAVS